MAANMVGKTQEGVRYLKGPEMVKGLMAAMAEQQRQIDSLKGIPPAPRDRGLQQWSPTFKEWQSVARIPKQSWSDEFNMWVNQPNEAEVAKQFPMVRDVPPEEVEAINRAYLARMADQKMAKR